MDDISLGKTRLSMYVLPLSSGKSQTYCVFCRSCQGQNYTSSPNVLLLLRQNKHTWPFLRLHPQPMQGQQPIVCLISEAHVATNTDRIDAGNRSWGFNPCSAIHKLLHVRSRSTIAIYMFIVIYSLPINQSVRYAHSCLDNILQSWLKWVQTTLVGSQWILNLLSNLWQLRLAFT